MKVKFNYKKKDYEFEIQEMSALDFYNVMTKFKLGQIDFKAYAETIFAECVVKPVEARKVEYFENIPKIADLLLNKCSQVSEVGLEENVKIEIIEE